MENIRKHRNIGLVTTEEKYLRTVMKPNFNPISPGGGGADSASPGILSLITPKRHKISK